MHLFTRRVGFLFVFVSCYIGLVLHLLHFCVCTFVWFLHLLVYGICLYICLVSCLIWCYSNSPERYYSSIHWCWQSYVKSSCCGRVKSRSCILWWILDNPSLIQIEAMIVTLTAVLTIDSSTLVNRRGRNWCGIDAVCFCTREVETSCTGAVKSRIIWPKLKLTLTLNQLSFSLCGMKQLECMREIVRFR